MTDAEKAEARKNEIKKDRGSMANRIGDMCLIGLQSESGPRVVENAELIEFASRGEFIAMKFRFSILQQVPSVEPTPENPNPPVKEIVHVVEQWYDSRQVIIYRMVEPKPAVVDNTAPVTAPELKVV